VIRLPRPADTGDMTRVSIAGHPLTVTAALVWNGDLPRPLQQILFDTPPTASSRRRHPRHQQQPRRNTTTPPK
jgi:hypothetical protein